MKFLLKKIGSPYFIQQHTFLPFKIALSGFTGAFYGVNYFHCGKIRDKQLPQ